ncbi:HemK family protein methyltransferase [Streptomyces sp. NPDC059788]|uniref:HemK family protein methyltransferase n=1 Tax=Streptomyces sp. NPDC059788 TaxID=3346948 RepID=UPI00364BE1BC
MSLPLSSPLPPASRPALVTRLRAAGCVFAEDEARLLLATARTPSDLAAMTDRRVAGHPLEQVLGWAEFCGLRITVDPGVFVPRRRTEFLVGQAAALVRARTAVHPRPVVVDLCCGTGAVGTALAAAAGTDPSGAPGANGSPGASGTSGAFGAPASPSPIELHAADIEPAAVRCARRNIPPATGRVYEGDLYAPLPRSLRGRVDILVVNAPYVPTEAIGLLPPEARDHEPRVALDGGTDGLDVQRRVAAGTLRWLAPGGHLLIETSERQAPRTLEALRRNGLATRLATDDDLGATVAIGTAPAASP